MIYRQSVIRDGSNTLILLWEIDTTRPKVAVVGHEYQFNTRLVDKLVVSTVNDDELVARRV